MKHSDNSKQIFRDMQEHPERYSDEQLEAMMADIDREPDVEKEWQAFLLRQASGNQNDARHATIPTHAARRTTLWRVAAAFAALLVTYAILAAVGLAPTPFARQNITASNSPTTEKPETMKSSGDARTSEQVVGSAQSSEQESKYVAMTQTTQTEEAKDKKPQKTDDQPSVNKQETSVAETVPATTEKAPTTYATGEVMPQFPGGTAALEAFINKNIRCPESVLQAGMQARVLINFLVTEDGTPQDFRVFRTRLLDSEGNPCADPAVIKLCEEEALRVSRLMPKWTPGSFFGKPKAYKYIIPIKFNEKKGLKKKQPSVPEIAARATETDTGA